MFCECIKRLWHFGDGVPGGDRATFIEMASNELDFIIDLVKLETLVEDFSLTQRCWATILA